MREPDEREEQEPSPYLRRSKRVEVRRSFRWRRILLMGGGIAILSGGTLAAAAYGINTYLTKSPRFTLGESLEFSGTSHVSKEQIDHVFAYDVGHSIFALPLEERRKALMLLPWVEQAYVMRSWPNRVRVVLTERKPVAFVRLKSGLSLTDREGVLLPLPRRGNFTLPVLTGAGEGLDPVERKRRVATMLAVLADFDRESPQRSGEVSEVDLTDPTDAAITVSAGGRAVLVHLGDAHFLDRYKLFLENIEAWRDQYGSVRNVDLRFEKQVVVKP